MSTFEILDIAYRNSAVAYFQGFQALGKRVWLDSGKPLSDYGEYDILSAAPRKVLVDPQPDDLQALINSATANFKHARVEGAQDLPFFGGLIGYFNYEYNHEEYRLARPHTGRRPSVFGVFDWALIQSHAQKRAWLVFLPSCAEALKVKVKNLVHSPTEKARAPFFVDRLDADITHENYRQAFAKINDYILAGDTYQINFAQRFSGDFSGAADAAYLALRDALPSPFSAYIELTDDIVMSFSPERFIRIRDGKAISSPIKGTAPRGNNPKQDHDLANKLRFSEKNRAENLMIVDLLRNDFSKSCKPFSVKVPQLFALESFANVHHLVSTIEGELEENTATLDFFMRCFPGGSITGAPKKRAMEIIDELEAHPRNIYCGSLCYFSANGAFDSNIAIRTLLASEGKIYCWGGGGIVADSQATGEFEESLQKISILIETLKSGSSSDAGY